MTLTARSDGLERAEIEQAGGRALAFPADVTDPGGGRRRRGRTEREFGAIDIWVNCAMATIFAPVRRITPDEFRRATEVTYLGYVYGTMAALKRMRPRNRGTIVQVGSALAYRAIPLQSAYCGAKFAIRGFTDSLRSELLHDGSAIHLTMVQMPALNTPQFDWARNKMPRRPQPVPPIFQPEVAAEAIVFAAYARRREVWVGWPDRQGDPRQQDRSRPARPLSGPRGYDGQLTDEPAAPAAPDNLFEPLPGDHGAHGRFDARAKAARHPALGDPAPPGLIATGDTAARAWGPRLCCGRAAPAPPDLIRTVRHSHKTQVASARKGPKGSADCASSRAPASRRQPAAASARKRREQDHLRQGAGPDPGSGGGEQLGVAPAQCPRGRATRGRAPRPHAGSDSRARRRGCGRPVVRDRKRQRQQARQ